MATLESIPPKFRRAAIPFVHWSARSFRNGVDGWSDIVAELADLEQGIANLIHTPLGSIAGNPMKGVNIGPYIDLPAPVAIPQLKSEIWNGLNLWHPRILLQTVDVTYDAADQDFATYNATVVWSPREGVLDTFQTVVGLNDNSVATLAAQAVA